MVRFPSTEWVGILQQKCNSDPDFGRATRWSDVKVLLSIGDKRYWMKWYKGKVIDTMEYLPMQNPLGFDYSISGSMESWKQLIERKRVFGDLINSGDVMVDGNLLEANRMGESTHILAELIRQIKVEY